jgi:hypothetical protein
MQNIAKCLESLATIFFSEKNLKIGWYRLHVYLITHINFRILASNLVLLLGASLGLLWGASPLEGLGEVYAAAYWMKWTMAFEASEGLKGEPIGVLGGQGKTIVKYDIFA